MTLNELVCRAASVYPEGYPLQYWNADKQEPRPNPLGGDTLAQFIAHELADTYDEEASDSEQLDKAIRKMREAANDLYAVVTALENLKRERSENHGRQMLHAADAAS
jgi:hypothetical protein